MIRYNGIFKWWLAPLATAILAGCVSERIDYSLAQVRTEPAGRGLPKTATLKIVDLRYAEKQSIATYTHKAGSYNSGLEIPRYLADYGEILGKCGAKPDARWYIAPDRLYWVSSGPIESLGEMIGRHLERAGRFAAVKVEPPSTFAGAADTVGKDARLVITIRRFLALKERRPGPDTFGFLGLSALSSSIEVTAIDAEWRLTDHSGREIRHGSMSRVINTAGSSFRAKNKPFKQLNAAAEVLGRAIAESLR